jgi:hypothetical protein
MLRLLSAISVLVAIAFFGIISIPFSALAQSSCAPHADAIVRLAERYQETQVAIAVIDNGNLLEVTTTADGSTWSIIVTTPDGTSCLVTSGTDWQARNQASTDPEA